MRSLAVCAVAACLLGAGPVAVPGGDKPSLPVEELTLDNGMRFLLVPRPGSPFVAAAWGVRAGSGDEAPGSTGLAHLLEHLMFHGTEKLGKGELARLYTDAGATGINAVTDEDFTLYYGLVPRNKLELWFWIESDRLLAPVFRDVDNELKIVAEERRQRLESTPTGAAAEKLQALVWQGHPYAWPTVGRAEDMETVQAGEAEAFFAAHYSPDRLSAVLVGDFDPAAVKKLARTYFGRLTRTEGGAPPATPPAPEAGSERRMAVACDCAAQARVVYRTVPFGHPDHAALDVLSGLLNGRTGRLHAGLVLERQIAFAAYSLHEPQRRGGAFWVTLEAKGKTPPADLIAAWDAEVRRLAAAPPPERELQKVKNLITTDAYRRLQDPLNLALRLLIYDAQGDWRHLDRWPEATLAVTADDVRRVAATYFKAESRTVGVFGRDVAPDPNPHPLAPSPIALPSPGRGGTQAPLPARERRGGEVRAHPRELRFTDLAFAVPTVEPVRLPGGVAVYVVEDHTLPLVDVVVAVRAGDYVDPADKVGLAALTGLQVRRGGTAAKGPDAIDEAVDLLGATIDSFGGSTRSGATLNCASHVLPQALDLFLSMVETPRFDQSRLALAKANLEESLSRRNDSPLEVLEREWGFLLFGPEHYTARQLLPRHLAAISRQDLADFHRRFWSPKGMVLAVSGDVDKAAVVAQLARHFAEWPGAGEKARWPPPDSKEVPRPGLYHVEHDTPQAKIALGHLGSERRNWSDADPFALQVMNEILGGNGPLSRLRARLRFQLGLVYRASSAFGVGLGGPGEFQVFLETDNANAGRVVSLALDEIRRLREQPVPEAELAVAKKSLIDGFPLLFDTAGKVAGRLAEDEYLGRPHAYWTTWREQIESVSVADVLMATQKYLRPDRMVVLTVGKWQDIAAGAKKDGVSLERLAGGAMTRIPLRDPVTLDAK